MVSDFDKYRTRTWAEIDIDALASNYSKARAGLSASTKLYAVIKANAYGHGAKVVGPWLEKEADADGFAVATLDEAIELRSAGVERDVLVLGYTDPIRYRDLFDYSGIIITLYSFESAKALSETAEAANVRSVRCYLAVDTGMSRIGLFGTEKGINEAVAITKLKNIDIEGVFSHFARADECNVECTICQEESFHRFKEAVESKIGRKLLGSIYNSAASIEGTPGGELDIARVGILLYGLRPSRKINSDGYLPAMSLKTRVIRVETVEKGTGISYGHTFVTSRDTVVATLSVGYGDGYPRALSNNGSVIIRGRKCRILGCVCMDMMMVDVSDVPGVSVGDTAVLFGRDGDSEIRIDDVAESINTIGYELLCGITCRVPRIYRYHDDDIDVLL